MKKAIAFLLVGFSAGLLNAGTENVVITFSTQGPDMYADGTVVANGESYALVWTPTGSEFHGIKTDGTAAGDSKVVIKAPVASDGKCPTVQFQIDESYASANFPNGTWGVYLLDTRRFQTEDVTITVDGKEIVQQQVVLDANGKKVVSGVGGVVAGFGAVSANIGKTLAGGATSEGIASGTVAAGIQPPTVKDFKVIDGKAYLYLKGTQPGVLYGVAGGKTLSTIKPTGDRPVCGATGDETIVVTPATGSSGFFTGIVQ